MLAALFTSRVILQTLGVTDYGIYNIVGGVVAMLSFLTASLSATTQRFLNVEMGKNDFTKLKQVFANSLLLHIIFILPVIILAETVGLWFLQNKLVIPPERAAAAFWVYQLTVISFAKTIFFAPFYGAIRAHEKFSFYAKMSVFDAVMKLVIVYLLILSPYDKLIALSFMRLCTDIIVKLVVYIYCHKNFEECKLKLSWSKDCVRQLLGYNVYSIIGAVSSIIRVQGLNIVLNLYYGPVMNAAQGIANMVYIAISSFSSNAAAATKPQIIMSYAQDDKKRLWGLITKSSKLYFYLLLILVLPFILEIDAALYIWLGDYPEYAPVFARLFLLEALQNVLLHPIMFANSAVGKLRAVTVISVVCRLFMLLFAVFAGINKLAPTYIYIFGLCAQGINLILIVIIVLKMQLGFSLSKYCDAVLWPISKICLLTVPVPAVLHYFFSKSTLSSCTVGIFALIWSGAIVFFVGLNKREKRMIADRLPFFLRKILYP
jgi:O-antigen/teichoic acid export membrane protein